MYVCSVFWGVRHMDPAQGPVLPVVTGAVRTSVERGMPKLLKGPQNYTNRPILPFIFLISVMMVIVFALVRLLEIEILLRFQLPTRHEMC